MKAIRLLDEDTINAIAAGEVVERPASVVKELVENAIDAHASVISIEIAGGGIDLIRVTDNGDGIAREDIRDAFQRHATSKITNVMDLLGIGTLGFRGEALSSIAAVSRTELLTKTRDQIAGIRFLVEGGKEGELQEVACPDGTTILVRNLFYNTPARRKFLKTVVTEAGYVSDLVSRLALSRPDISFKFSSGGQMKLSTSGNGSLKDVIYQVFGREAALHLIPAENNPESMPEWLRISGFIGKPILSRGNRSWENYFINGRYIRSDIITKAIEDAYKTFVMIHKFPFTALQFEIEPELIDVNVHPRKLEIRFNRNEEIYSLVYESVRTLLQTKDLTPQGSFESPVHKQKNQNRKVTAADIPEPFEVKKRQEIAPSVIADSSTPFLKTQKKPSSAYKEEISIASVEKGKISISSADKREVSLVPVDKQESINDPSDQTENISTPAGSAGRQESFTVQSGGQESFLELTGRQQSILPDNLLDKQAAPFCRLVGQVFGTYWILEFAGKMYMMDQHAAHEKILYEKIRKDFEKGFLAIQHLTPPVVITLSAREQEILENNQDLFTSFGFEIEPFGGNEYAIYGVPSYLFGMNIRDLFIEVLDSLTPERGSIEGSQITWKIASMACKAAVKGNQVLSEAEALALLDELRDCDDPYNCPHGRPTIVSFSRYEIDKRFKRIQD